MARRPRGLRPDEEDLWNRVARSATPMHPARPKAGPSPTPDKPKDKGPVPSPKERAPAPPFRVGQASKSGPLRHDLAPSIAEQLSSAPVRMDRKAYLRLNRGKLAPEGRIDLHGMTLAEAHPELIRFLLNAHSDGKRLVLVITGKGRDGDGTGPIPQRRGVLRHQLPQWLAMPPLGTVVLQVTQAHRKHGGEGAFYVYLRRG
ncbi:Smr/MutS family protein [Acidimangrovimonas sediminis]|uniref:Smr/MutS family protein n=1 Tax=Acidimangrovimonas sediminis TaxID=2056283 RepID=UPI000C801F5F|nr:Smr/MutS family protein [Acidimangrovimonas sediminis]